MFFSYVRVLTLLDLFQEGVNSGEIKLICWNLE